MHGRYESPKAERIATSPGPAAYNPEKHRRIKSCRLVSPKRTRMGEIKAEIDKNEVPGPGTYAPTSPRTIGAQFSKDIMPVLKPTRKQGPGPGDYESPTKVAIESPKFTFVGRATDLKKDVYPAPDAYSQPNS